MTFNAEWIGIPAAVLVLLSYVFSNQLKLRIVNTVASMLFVVYGFIIAIMTNWSTGWSTIILNTLSTIVHIVWIIRYFLSKRKELSKEEPDDTEFSADDRRGQN